MDQSHLLSFNWDDASGIEVRSTESRREAPWIEVHSTEAFLFNWGHASGIEVRSTEAFNSQTSLPKEKFC